jgi:superfamily I DNA/RNA helicase
MKLTLEQKGLWDNDLPKLGLHIVSARAGTGKTTLLTQYCIDLEKSWHDMGFKSWQGIAMLSYTNVAKNELTAKLKKEKTFSGLLDMPNTVQTLDSFCNENIFLPFAGKYMGAGAIRPKLVGEPFGHWKLNDESTIKVGKEAGLVIAPDAAHYFDKFHYNINGVLTPGFGLIKTEGDKSTIYFEKNDINFSMGITLKDGNFSKAFTAISNYKAKLTANGIATQTDANYFSYKILSASESVLRSLISRFPVIIIDEAQDMTEVQHAMLDTLVKNGLANVILVGDGNQAIYEWNTAKPELFLAKYSNENNDWQSHDITETFRNGANICTALNSLTVDNEIKPSKDSKSVKLNYDDKVGIIDWSYNENDGEAFKCLVDKCAGEISKKHPHDDSELTLAVIARSSKTIETLRTFCFDTTSRKDELIKFEHPESREILKLLYDIEHKSVYEATASYERVLRYLYVLPSPKDVRSHVSGFLGETKGSLYYAYRLAVWNDVECIKQLIKSQEKIGALEFISDLNLLCIPDKTKLANIRADFSKVDVKDRKISSIHMRGQDRLPEYHSIYKNVRLVFSTTHGVKGETYDGVLFVQKHVASVCGCLENKRLTLAIASHEMKNCEEKRVQYVAMSRAAQTLWLAVAPEDAGGWVKKVGGVLLDLDCVKFVREWKQMADQLKSVDENLSTALKNTFPRIDDQRLLVYTNSKKDFKILNQDGYINAIGVVASRTFSRNLEAELFSVGR